MAAYVSFYLASEAYRDRICAGARAIRNGLIGQVENQLIAAVLGRLFLNTLTLAIRQPCLS